jgi:VIT1/CCC1 family predicted Fe2+/Mn2+ transporter
MVVPRSFLLPVIAGSSLILLSILGASAARLGGASKTRGAARVTFWGVVAMGATALVGHLFGAMG